MPLSPLDLQTHPTSPPTTHTRHPLPAHRLVHPLAPPTPPTTHHPPPTHCTTTHHHHHHPPRRRTGWLTRSRLAAVARRPFADAEMGDFEPSGLAHAVGSGLAAMNGPVYVWNHPKKTATMSPEYVAAGLQGHLLVGVFPMVPVKNNDHGIGGDCAPDCPYDDVYISYGAIFRALRGRRWHLAAHGVVVHAPDSGAGSVAPALGNVFHIPSGTLNIAGVPKASAVLLAAVVFAPQFGRVQAIINGVDLVLPCCTDQTACAASMVHSVIQPGDTLDADGLVVPGSYDPTICTKSSTSPPAGGSNITRGCATVGAPLVTSNGAGIAVSVDIIFGVDPAIAGSNTNAALIALSCLDGHLGEIVKVN